MPPKSRPRRSAVASTACSAARAGVLHGILNGIDEAVWNPWTDPHLPARFRRGHLRNKPKCKAALQTRLGLDGGAGRAALRHRQPADRAERAWTWCWRRCRTLLAAGAQLAVLGTGDAALEDDVSARRPRRIRARWRR